LVVVGARQGREGVGKAALSVAPGESDGLNLEESTRDPFQDTPLAGPVFLGGVVEEQAVGVALHTEGVGVAARACNLDRRTVWHYRRAHQDFEEEIKAAEADYCNLFEKALLKDVRKLNMSAIVF
jgi:hypothetical protein